VRSSGFKTLLPRRSQVFDTIDDISSGPDCACSSSVWDQDAVRETNLSMLALLRFALILLFLLTCVAAIAADIPEPVFVKTACDGKISSVVLSSLRNEISTSQKYRLAHNLTDGDRMGVVLTININCAERPTIAAVASAYGLAKCFGERNCHLSIDGASLRSDLCDSDSATECGRALFKAFDEYVTSPIKPPLRLQ
jgi:hypothetical protein